MHASKSVQSATSVQAVPASGGSEPAFRLPPVAPEDLELGEFVSAEGYGPRGARWAIQRVSVARADARVRWGVRFADGRRVGDVAPDQYEAAKRIHLALGVALPPPVAETPAADEQLAAVLGVLGCSIGEVPFVLARLRDRAEAAEARVRELESEVGQLRAEREVVDAR